MLRHLQVETIAGFYAFYCLFQAAAQMGANRCPTRENDNSIRGSQGHLQAQAEKVRREHSINL